MNEASGESIAKYVQHKCSVGWWGKLYIWFCLERGNEYQEPTVIHLQENIKGSREKDKKIYNWHSEKEMEKQQQRTSQWYSVKDAKREKNHMWYSHDAVLLWIVL